MEKATFPALQELVDRMKQERRPDGTLHIAPDPADQAEPIDKAPSDFGKGAHGGSS